MAERPLLNKALEALHLSETGDGSALEWIESKVSDREMINYLDDMELPDYSISPLSLGFSRELNGSRIRLLLGVLDEQLQKEDRGKLVYRAFYNDDGSGEIRLAHSADIDSRKANSIVAAVIEKSVDRLDSLGLPSILLPKDNIFN